tara:strand:+ start:450 stop:848 length:399 start_codon:yes stop_codon:yes gene_type:complete
MSGLVESSADARSKTIGGNYRCRAIVRCSAIDGGIDLKMGVSSVSDNGVGQFSVNLDPPMPDIKYIAVANISFTQASYNDDHLIGIKERYLDSSSNIIRTTSLCQFWINMNTNGGGYTDNVDMIRMDVAIFR